MGTGNYYYNSPSGVSPTSRAEINFNITRDKADIIVEANVSATLVYSSGFINYDGEINFNMSYGSNSASATIKEYYDRWSVGTPRTREVSCSMRFPSTESSFTIDFNISTPSPNQSLNTGDQSITIETDAFVKPTNPTWFSYTPNPCSINQAPLFTWGGAQAGSTGVLRYDIIVRSSKPEGGWTEWLQISNNQVNASYQEVVLSQMNIYGVKPFYGVRYQYGIRSSDGGYSTADSWYHPADVVPIFREPTAPSDISVSTTSPKLDGSVTLKWSGATGGDGKIEGYRLDVRSSRKGSGSWAVWVKKYEGSNTSYTYDIQKNFPTAKNGDSIQFRISTYNSWGQTSSYSYSAVITFRSNQIYVKVNGSWREGILYVKVNGNWREGKPYIKVNASWREGT